MNRLCLVLSGLLAVCALGLVTSQHGARKTFVDLEHARAQARQLEVQWERLQVEQSRLANAALIDSRARSGLTMSPATPERTLYLNLELPREQTAMESRR